jgi:LPXTG-motif cell wall-anchored protein
VLPFTGTNADQMLAWGVTVLMFGLLIAIAGRRRRSA